MDAGLFRKLIDEIHLENPSAVVLPFWRGESCLHPGFGELLEYAFDKGLRIHLSTNGHFMDRAFMDVFYRCEFLTLSLHTRRGYGNAKRLVEEKPEWSTTTIQVSFVDSEKSTEKFLSECVGDDSLKGFDAVRLYVEHTVGGTFGKSVNTTAIERTFCPKLTDTFVVSADGEFSRCNHIWMPETTPNLHQTTIREVWCGERMAEIRRRYPDDRCAPCDQWSGHTTGEAWRKGEGGGVVHVVFGEKQQ